MISTVISVQLRVGSVPPNDTHRKVSFKEILKYVKESGLDFTIVEAKGRYKLEPVEASAIVDFFWVLDFDDPLSGVVRFCDDIDKLVRRILVELSQREIIVIITVTRTGHDVRWSRRITPDSAPTITHPSLLAFSTSRRSDEIDLGAKLGIPALRKAVIEHYIDLEVAQNAKTYSDVPAFFFPAIDRRCYDLTKVDNCEDEWRDFDAAVLEWDTERKGYPNPVPLRVVESADFVSLFRQVTDSPVLYLTNLAEKFVQTEPTATPLETGICSYRDGLGSTEGAYLEMLDAWVRLEMSERPFREWLNKHRSTIQLYSTPRPALAVEVVTLSPEHDIILRKRGASVAAYPNMLISAPAGALEPLPGIEQPSVIGTFIRELHEEVFGGPESGVSVSVLRREEHIVSLSGTLTYLGFMIDLLRLEVDICLLFKPSTKWWDKYSPRFRLNWEFASGAVQYTSLADAYALLGTSPASFVPSAAVAIAASYGGSNP